MLYKFKDSVPEISDDCYIAHSSEIIGNVKIGSHSSIWPKAILRGDICPIEIGDFSNIQDGCVLHVDWDKPVIIGNHVTVGHNACVHGCKIEDEVLIGIGANVLSGANISKHCIVGAGSVVRENQLLEEGFLYAGVPAKKIRALTEEEKTNLKKHAVKYSELSNEFKKDKVKKLLKLM